MLDSKTLEQLKQKLLSEKKRLEEDLLKFTKKSATPGEYDTKWEDYGDDEDENAAEVAAYTDSLGLEHTFESELSDIDLALQRIEKGTFGLCTKCGKEIDLKRLLVRPQSALCTTCMEKNV